MSFFGNLLNSIPGVGHAKGIVHFAFGDVQGGACAMKEATKSTVGMGAGTIGAIAGPVVAIAAATAATAVTGVILEAGNTQQIKSFQSFKWLYTQLLF
jgi:hypothetical protein